MDGNGVSEREGDMGALSRGPCKAQVPFNDQPAESLCGVGLEGGSGTRVCTS